MRIFFIFFSSITFILRLLSADTPAPDHTILIPMRDGTVLTTDLYLPSPEARHLPCVLVRTASGRHQKYYDEIIALASKGYVIAIQDTRSAMDSEGKTMPYIADGWGSLQDGYDAIEWLAHSEWTNGRVGTVGWSAMGITQLLLAPSAPPSLKCQYVGMAAASLYHHAIYGGGEFHKNSVETWLSLHARDPEVLKTVTSQPFYNSFWSQFNTMKVAHKVTVPAVHLGGWYDLFLQGTIDGFIAREEKGGIGAKGTQKLIIGPWAHFWPKDPRLGDFMVPEAGQKPPVDLSTLSWFDYYLKDSPTGVKDLPAVTYYVMGPLDGSPSKGNVWKSSSHWPVPSKACPLFLTPQNEMVSNIHAVSAKKFQYAYDPNNPVPTVGGRNLLLESGAKDQRSLESRKDVLSFTTKPLTEDLEVTGRLKAVLYISSDINDTDLAVRLCDVYPDGRSVLVADGLTRTKHLHCPLYGIDDHYCLPEEIEVDLSMTSMVFAKGHSIRVSVTHSNYPAYEKGISKACVCTLHVGKNTPSRIVLPIALN